jgi:hypothetical protein
MRRSLTRAYEKDELDGLVALLTEDDTLSMPPVRLLWAIAPIANLGCPELPGTLEQNTIAAGHAGVAGLRIGTPLRRRPAARPADDPRAGDVGLLSPRAPALLLQTSSG